MGHRPGLDAYGKSSPIGIRSPGRPAYRDSLNRLHRNRVWTYSLSLTCHMSRPSHLFKIKPLINPKQIPQKRESELVTYVRLGAQIVCGVLSCIFGQECLDDSSKSGAFLFKRKTLLFVLKCPTPSDYGTIVLRNKRKLTTRRCVVTSRTFRILKCHTVPSAQTLYFISSYSDTIFFFFFQCHHMSFCGLRGPPSWAWQKCNRLLSLGSP